MSLHVTSARPRGLHLFSALMAPLVVAAQMWTDRHAVREQGTLPWASNPSRKKMLALSRVSTDARKKHSNTETGSRLPPNRSPDSQLPSVMKRQSEWPQRWMLSDCDGTKSNHSISLIVREDIYERVHSATGDYRLVLCRFAQILLITRVVEEEGDQSRKPRGARVGERPPYGF